MAGETTHERYETRINRAIGLIERRLDAALPLQALASEACLSPFHFHRVFHSLVGETVHAFTGRLRLERALKLARFGQPRSWKDIATQVGYRSLPVFSRAFKRQYGCSPAAFDLENYWSERPDVDDAWRVSAHFLRPAPPMPDDFQVDLRHRPEQRRVMSRTRGGYLDPAVLIRGYERLVEWAQGEGFPVDGGRLSGASQDDPDITPLARCRYDFALDVDTDVRAPGQGMAIERRPAGWWAVHAVDGDLAAVDRAWNTLFKGWLPAAGLDLREVPAEEVYLRTPAEIGWERFDVLCCIPIEPPDRTPSP
jgi:AraC family transcriptional regulator